MQLNRYIRLLSASLLLFVSSTSGFAQRQSPKPAPKAPSQPSANVIPLTLEEPGAAMVFGNDGMLYVVSSYGGRYSKGTISRLNPEAFSRPQRTKDGHNHALPEDLTEVYVFGRPEETGAGEKGVTPRAIILGGDGKLYVSGDSHFCAQFDPATHAVEWIKLGPGREDFQSRDPSYSMSRDPDSEFLNASGDCIAVTKDGLLWCKGNGQGRAGKVFHTRGGRKDLGQILGTEQWTYATLADDGYFYGATDDALVRVKKTDGSDITVLHAFAGKDDHPVGAPILIGNTLFGCAHDERKGSRSGYIYQLNPDGTGYSTVVKLDYDPAPRFESQQPLIAYGNSLYGMAPAGLFTLSVGQPTPKIIVPTKEATHPAAIVLQRDAAYVLGGSSQSDASIFRVPISQTSPTAAASPAAQIARGSAPPGATASMDAAPTTPAPATSAAPAPGGKSVFHKRQTTDASQGADGAPAGSPANAADEGMSAKPRPGLPPRQSKGQVSSSVAPTTGDTAPPPADESTGVATSSGAPSTAAAPVPGGKSVFHKRQSSDDSQGAPPDAEGASAGSSPTTTDQGISTKPRPGLPPRQSRTPAKIAAASPSAESENSVSSTEQPSTGWGSSSPSAQQPSSFGSRNAEGKGRKSVPSSDTSMGDTSDASGIAEKVVQAFSDGDVETFGALYADTVDYYNKGRISSDGVRSELQEYFARWPVRQWTITTPVKVESLGASVQRVTFSARYEVSNPQTGRRLSGTAKETMMLAADSTGAMKIISHHEQTGASREKPGKSNERRDRREKIYDSRPVIPLPPNIPWPPGIPHP